MNIIVVAWEANKIIGLENGLPWQRIKNDLKLFKERTMGHALIMGRKTWESFGAKPLPGRLNVVLSRQDIEPVDGAVFVKTWEEALAAANAYKENEDVFIIGGAEIYRQALEQKIVDKMIVSWVFGIYKGDTFFPEFDENEWDVRTIVQYEEFDLREYTKK